MTNWLTDRTTECPTLDCRRFRQKEWRNKETKSEASQSISGKEAETGTRVFSILAALMASYWRGCRSLPLGCLTPSVLPAEEDILEGHCHWASPRYKPLGLRHTWHPRCGSQDRLMASGPLLSMPGSLPTLLSWRVVVSMGKGFPFCSAFLGSLPGLLWLLVPFLNCGHSDTVLCLLLILTVS